MAMIAYHVLFDLDMLDLVELKLDAVPLELMADVTAATFFAVVGISLNISYFRSKRTDELSSSLARKYLLRGAKLLVMGGFVTGITYFLYPEFVVLFGALQFIAVSIVLGYILLELTDRWRRIARLSLLVIIPGIFIFLAPYIRGIRLNFPYLIWLGVIPPGFQSLDYFPLFPWFGYVVAGLLVGDLIYPSGKRRWEGELIRNSTVGFIGRHSLIIYFLHQPFIYAGIVVFNILSGGGPVLF